MALHGSAREQWLAALHPNTPPQVLHRLAEAHSLHAQVAENPAADPRTLMMVLAKFPTLAPAVAGNPSCPEELLDVLVAHDAPSVRAAVASNPVCGEQRLRRLVHDDFALVRDRAAAHPQCPEECQVVAGLMSSPRQLEFPF